MTGKQRAVMWIGLILIAFNLVRKWPEISGVIFGHAPASIPKGTGSALVSVDPSVPSPKITVPVSSLSFSYG